MTDRPLTARPLTPWDQIYLGYQRADDGRSLDKGTLLFLEGPPPSDREWRAHIAGRLERWPALRQRLVPLPDTPGEWGWSTDAVPGAVPPADSPAAYHAAVWVAPPTLTGRDAARAAADALAATRLDLARAPWRAYLIRDGRADGFAILYRSSHVQQDGIAMHVALWMLFGPDTDPPPMGQLRPARTDRPATRDLAAALARSLRERGGANRLAAWGGPPTGPSRHDWVETDLTTLRRASRRHGVSINDVYLAALAGAMRAWAPAEWDARRPVLHTLMPVSVRPPQARHVLGNYSAIERVALPCGEPDPRRRLELVAARTGRIKDAGPAVLERAVLGRLRPGTIRRLAAASTRVDTRGGGQFPVVASNPRGMSGPLAVAGRPITGLVHLPARITGVQPLCVVISGIDDQVGVGFTISATVPGGERIPELWLDEALRLAGPAVPAGTAGTAGTVTARTGAVRSSGSGRRATRSSGSRVRVSLAGR